MKRALLISLLFATAMMVNAFDLHYTTNSILVWHADSLDEDSSAPPVTGFRRSHYVFAMEACLNPSFTNQYYDFAHSGQIMDLRLTNDVPELTPGVVGYRTNQLPAFLFSVSTDNGLLTSNLMYGAQSNMCQLMTNMSLGAFPLTAQTGILSSNHPTFIIVGNQPDTANDGGDSRGLQSMRARNAACTNAGINFGSGYVDLFNPLYSGWTNDMILNGGNTIGVFAGTSKAGHIEAAGSLNMAIAIEQQIHPSDTNIARVIIDWNSQTVTLADHAVVSGILLTGNTLTWTNIFTRIPGGWDDSATDPTNNAFPGFTVIPSQANAFLFTLGGSNLPSGNYAVQIDGVTVATQSSTVLGTGMGWNMFTNMVGPLWAQRKEVLRRIRVAQHVDTTTLQELPASDGAGLVSYGSTAFGFWSGGAKGDTLIADLDAKVTQLQTNWTYINLAAQPTPHTFSLQLITPRSTMVHR